MTALPMRTPIRAKDLSPGDIAVLEVLVEYDWGVGCSADDVGSVVSSGRISGNPAAVDVVVGMLLADLWRWGLIEIAGSAVSQGSGLTYYRITVDGRLALLD